MNAESLKLSTSQGATTAYVARPQEDSAAGVILVQEYWGINEHIRDLAGRFAQQGYLCVAPDLYRGRVAEDKNQASALMQALPIKDGIETIRKAIDERANLLVVHHGLFWSKRQPWKIGRASCRERV